MRLWMRRFLVGERTEEVDGSRSGEVARWRERPRSVLASCSSTLARVVWIEARLAWLRSLVRPLIMSGAGEDAEEVVCLMPILIESTRWRG